MKEDGIDLGHLSVRALHNVLSETTSHSAPTAILAIPSFDDDALDQMLGSQWDRAQIESLRRDLDEGASVQTLVEWKQNLKDVWSDCNTAEERRVVMVFQHAVIARVYSEHGEWITSRPKKALLPLYEDLAHALKKSALSARFVAAVERAIREAVAF